MLRIVIYLICAIMLVGCSDKSSQSTGEEQVVQGIDVNVPLLEWSAPDDLPYMTPYKILIEEPNLLVVDLWDTYISDEDGSFLQLYRAVVTKPYKITKREPEHLVVMRQD